MTDLTRVSIYVEPNIHDFLKGYAKLYNMSVSALLRDVIYKCLMEGDYEPDRLSY